MLKRLPTLTPVSLAKTSCLVGEKERWIHKSLDKTTETMGRKTKMADRMAVTTITGADRHQLKYRDSASIPHLQRQSQLSSIRQNIAGFSIIRQV